MGSKKIPTIGKRNKKGSKKEKPTEGPHIAPGLIPTASMSAVRKNAPPPRPEVLEDLDMQGSSGVLSATLLNNMFTTQPDDGHVTEETDTSLFDYENAKPVLQSTFGSREFSHGSSLAPPQGFGDETDSETEIHATPRGHSIQVEAEVNPVYATPLRSSQRLSRSGSPSILRQSGPHHSDTGSHPITSTLRSSAGSPTFSSAISGTTASGSRRGRTPKRTPLAGSLEERVEAQMVDKSRSSLQSSLDKTLTRVSTDLSYSGSLRLNTLRGQNAALVEKQEQLERQLSEQRHLQEEVMTKLREQGLFVTQSLDATSTQDVGSLIEDTQRSTERTFDKQHEVISALKERVSVAEKTKRELEEMNEQLRTEIMSVHRLVSARDDDDSGSQGGVVKKLKDERDTLQAMVVKLSAELSRYQSKFRPLSQAELDSLPGLPTTGPKPSWLVNTKYLAPLFVAYDDQLKDKEDLLQDTEATLDQLHHQVEEVVRENQHLHVRLEQTDVAGPVGMTEWRALQEQCKLVVEENQLLMEQLDLQQHKTSDMTRAHVHEVSRLSKRLMIAEAERNQVEQEVSDIREKMTIIKKEYNETRIDSQSRLGVEEHTSALSQLKRTLEEEKTKHANELENMITKVQSLASERKSYSLQAEELRAENQTVMAEMKVLQKAQKRGQKKIELLQKALQDSSVKEETAERYLSSIIKVAEKTAKERDSFVEVAESEQREKKVAINKVIEGNFAKSKAEEKLKHMKSKATEKLEKAAFRIKEQDDDFNKQRQEYEREIKHLRLLLRERQDMIDSAYGDKRRVEDDLETMWQVATADNQRMRETLRKGISKLEEHGSLRVTMATTDAEKDLFQCDSDYEK